MASIDYKVQIRESAETLRIRMKDMTSPKLRDRCEVLLWLKTGKVRSMLACMRLKSLNKATGVKWWQTYVSEGLDGLLTTGHKGNVFPLDSHTALWNRLSQEGFSTIKEARDWLKQHYDISYTENGLGNYFRRKKVKCKTGRPHHPKRSEEARDAYQKNTKPC